MSKYIDADALRAKMYHDAFEEDSEEQKWDGGCWIRYKMFERNIDSMPTTDVVEVRHGRWEYVKKRLARGGYVDASECSVCHKIIMPHLKPNYCPNCGAKMDEVIE